MSRSQKRVPAEAYGPTVRRRLLCSFYLAASNAGRSSQEKAVCPSVRLSVKRTHYDKTKITCAHIPIPHERSLTLSSEKKNGWWGLLIVPEISG